MQKTKDIAGNGSAQLKDLDQISTDLVKISRSLRQQLDTKTEQAWLLTDEGKVGVKCSLLLNPTFVYIYIYIVTVDRRFKGQCLFRLAFS